MNVAETLDLEKLRAADEPRAYVWWCEDYDCDCTQAVIDVRAAWGTDPTCRTWGPFWRGQFYTDGESGAADDLQMLKDYLFKREPELAKRIVWP